MNMDSASQSKPKSDPILANALGALERSCAGATVGESFSLTDQTAVADINCAPERYDCPFESIWVIAGVVAPFTMDVRQDAGPTTRVRASVGECRVLPPDTPCASDILTQGKLRYFIIDDARFFETLGDTLEKPLDIKTLSSGFRSPVVNTLLQRIFLSAQNGDKTTPFYTDALTNAMIAEIAIQFEQPTWGCSKNIALKLDATLMHRLDEMIAAENGPVPQIVNLASEAGMSVSRFSKMFKETTNQTPYQYLMDLRIKKAQDLLQNSNKSLAQIAFACGFSSQSHMTDVFRVRIGITPGVFRKGS